uniref:Uncharacterized protein n=1 Tax=viral metagenome TaxID=1070528 RepID=A0A6C0DRM9_9ZZZZ
MASTRSKNTMGDYKMEQQMNISTADYNRYKSYGVPNYTFFSGDGLLAGRVASENLSRNACDIESYLRGIGSSNLVNPQPDVVADVYKLKSLAVIDRIPLIVPEPLVVAKDQRPLFR